MAGHTRITLVVLLAAMGCLGWTSAAGANSIGRASLNGSNVQPNFLRIAPTVEPPSEVSVAVDASHIYWTNRATHAIERANLDGSGVDPHFISLPDIPGTVDPAAVAVSAGRIYWSVSGGVPFDGEAGFIGRANIDGSDVQPNLIKTPSPVALAVDRAHVYWVSLLRRSIGRANLDGSDARTDFIKTSQSGGGLAVSASHIYWTREVFIRRPGTYRAYIGRARLNGSAVQPRFIAERKDRVLTGLALNAGHLYWSSSSSSPDTIGRAKLDGSGIQRSFITLRRELVGGRTIGGLAVNGAHIYWSSVVKPTIISLRVTPRQFRLTGRNVHGHCVPTTTANRTQHRCIRPVRLTITYKANLPGHTQFDLERIRTGRRASGQRCLAPKPRLRHHRKCTRRIPVAIFVRLGNVGQNKFTFTRRALAPGTYQLTATPAMTYLGGNTKTIKVRISR